jgi:hypothetical protein
MSEKTCTAVYIIYSADVISESTSDIEGMSPLRHLAHIEDGATIAAKFTETEGDDQYDFGYLGSECGDARYFPYGYADAEALTETDEPSDCPDCGGSGIRGESEAVAVAERDGISIEQARGYCGTCEASGELPPFGEGIARGLGQHRKWCGELTLEEWRTFARAYCIDLDDDEIMPQRFEETMGSLTEHGHIPAVCVDNREGWEHGSFGYGPVIGVLDSQMYVSFA